MKSLLGFLGFAILTGACHAADIDARADAKLADARASAVRQIDYVRCADGAPFGPGCGLVSRVAGTDAFRERFRAKVCGALTPDACQTAYDRMIDAELATRYPAADWQGVGRECDRRPGLCSDGVAYEKLLLSSHNARVQADYAEDEQKIDAERAAQHRADSEAAVRDVGALIDTAAVLGGARVCHSYPSVFGGEDTVCSR